MSRPLRIDYPGGGQHVMNRGRRRERVLLGDEDYYRFIVLLQEAARLWDVRNCAYCLMSNHYHLLIHTPLGNLSRRIFSSKKYTAILGDEFRQSYKITIYGLDETQLLKSGRGRFNESRAVAVYPVRAMRRDSFLGYCSSSMVIILGWFILAGAALTQRSRPCDLKVELAITGAGSDETAKMRKEERFDNRG